MKYPNNALAIAEKCRSKEISPVDLVKSTLKGLHTAEENIDAFLSVDDEAAIARAEQLIKTGPPENGNGLLFGVPIAIKDSISVEGFPMTCGSRILQDYRPVYNATVVKKILDEGGVILGKTNMDEFAMGSSTEYSAFKPTKNPWDLDRIPGGSSGGSAAAVASCAVPLALGSDTGGSIRQPAAFCGAVGFKPTYGAVSRFGLTAFASSLDQIGPISVSVQDAALLCQAIAGHDPLDSTSIPGYKPDLLGDLEKGIAGLKIGVPSEYFTKEISEDIRIAVENGIESLTQLGAERVDISLPHTEYAVPAYYLIANSETSSNLARYDGVRYGPRTTGDNLTDTYIKTRSAGFGNEVKRRIILGTFALSSGYYEAWYMKALKVRRLIQEDFNKAYQKVDLIIGPTSPVEPFHLNEKVDDPLTMYLSDILTVPASLAGAPALSMPWGFTKSGLPVGLQIIGPALGDSLVLQAARALEASSENLYISPVAENLLKERERL